MDYDDNELRRQLTQFGISPGPITDSTRDLYKRMLRKKIKATGKAHRQSAGSGSGRTNTPTSSNSHRTSNSGSRNTGFMNSPASNSRVNNKGTPNISYSVKRPASSASYEVQPKRPRLDVVEESLEISPEPSRPIAASSPKYQRLYPTLPEDVDSEYFVQPDQPTPVNQRVPPISQQPSNTPLANRTVSSISQHPSKSSLFKTPAKLPPRVSMSPPSPSPSLERSPSLDQSGNRKGLFSAVSGFIGAGVKKIVNQIASPRQPIRSERKSSTGSRKDSHSAANVSFGSSSLVASPPSSVSDTLPVDEVEESRIPPPDIPPPEPEPPEKKRTPSEGEERYDWELLPSDVEICKKADGSLHRLGKGGFGEVFKGLKDSVDEVAVKVIRIQNSAVAIEQFKREIDIISKLRHRHILQFYGACIQPNCFYMVTELMQTDLFSSLRNNKRYLWTGIYGKEVLLGVASGLHYLHSRRPPIVHRDIKSPNILLMDGIAKIADVGIARTKSDSDMTAQKGYTIAWAAPEVVYRRRATEKIDIWSFGVIIWEVVSGKMPRVGHLALPSDAPSSLHALYSSCVEEEPTKRPSAAEAIKLLKAIK